MSVTVFKLDSTMTFGKYKGMTVAKVLDINPDYLVWATRTVPWFTLDDEVCNDAVEISFQRKMRRYLKRTDFGINYNEDRY